MSGPRPAAWGGIEVASSSLTVPNWQPTFTLNNEPLPASASIRTWDKGEGGRVAQGLVHRVLLPEDVQFFSNNFEESIARQLQWHTIAVISSHSFSHLFCCTSEKKKLLLLLLLFFFFLLLSLLLWCYQAAQIIHILGERMKELVEEAEREKALKDVANATARDKGKAAEVAEKKA